MTTPPYELPAELLNARVRFWTCADHRRSGRVEWRGDVAYCLTEGCGRTSQSAPSEET